MAFFDSLGKAFKRSTELVLPPIKGVRKRTKQERKRDRKAKRIAGKTILNPDFLDEVAEISGAIGEITIVLGTLTGQPEIIAAGAGIELLGRGAETLAKVERSAEKARKAKSVSEAVGAAAEAAAAVAGATGNKELKSIAKTVKDVTKITAKFEGNTLGSSTHNEELLEHEQAVLQDSVKPEETIIQTEATALEGAVDVINEMADRLDEQSNPIKNKADLLRQLNRQEPDTVVAFLTRNKSVLDGLSEADRTDVIRTAITVGNL